MHEIRLWFGSIAWVLILVPGTLPWDSSLLISPARFIPLKQILLLCVIQLRIVNWWEYWRGTNLQWWRFHINLINSKLSAIIQIKHNHLICICTLRPPCWFVNPNKFTTLRLIAHYLRCWKWIPHLLWLISFNDKI